MPLRHTLAPPRYPVVPPTGRFRFGVWLRPCGFRLIRTVIRRSVLLRRRSSSCGFCVAWPDPGSFAPFTPGLIRRRPWGSPFAAFIPSGRHPGLSALPDPHSVQSSVLTRLFLPRDWPDKTLTRRTGVPLIHPLSRSANHGRSNRGFRVSSNRTIALRSIRNISHARSTLPPWALLHWLN